MLTKLTAFILSFLSIFMVWSPNAQPNNIPETRTVPYSDGAVPDLYQSWPTEDFTESKPQLLSPVLFRIFYALKGTIDGGSKTESLLILQKGKLVHESYAEGWDKNMPHFAASVTKSVAATLAGAAIHDGHIGGIDDKVLGYFPEAESKIPAGDSKRDMTIRHLLTMTSGIWIEAEEDWDAYFAPEMEDAALWAFLQPQNTAPGEKYTYDNIAPTILLGIVERASGQKALAYAQENLFGPLGMTSVQWGTTADGMPTGGFGIDMTPRDMLRLGYLYLNYGRWENGAIFDPIWAAQAAPKAMAPQAYGHTFWNNELLPFFGFYEADGAYGQFISIYPQWDLVVVRTGSEGDFWDGLRSAFDL